MAVVFHVTGFGPFGGGEVATNPTQARTLRLLRIPKAS